MNKCQRKRRRVSELRLEVKEDQKIREGWKRQRLLRRSRPERQGDPGTRAARRGAQGGGRRAGSLTGLVVVCQAAGLGCKVQGALQPLFLQQQR